MSIRGMLAGSIGLVAIAIPVHAADTTADRLLNTDKEPGNWLMVHHDYNNSRHSALTTINRDNAKDLKPKFIFSIGGRATGGTLRGKEEIDPAGGRWLHVCGRHLDPRHEVRRSQRLQCGTAVAL